MVPEPSDRLTRIETQLLFQERAIEELQKTLLAQENEIRRLRRSLERLLARMPRQAPEPGAAEDDADDEPEID